MDVSKMIQDQNGSLKKHVGVFLENFINPAFGVLTKKEIEFLVFQLMKDIGVIPDTPSLYNLMINLHLTKTKASQLLFDYEVRKFGDNQEQLAQDIIQALCLTKFTKDGDYFVLEIDRPFLQAYLKEKMRELGHITDGSFNQSIVRMNLDAVTSLMLNFIPEEKHNTIKQKLIEAGAPDNSIQGVLKSALKRLGSKVLGEVGASIALENAQEMLGSLFQSNFSVEKWKKILK